MSMLLWNQKKLSTVALTVCVGLLSWWKTNWSHIFFSLQDRPVFTSINFDWLSCSAQTGRCCESGEIIVFCMSTVRFTIGLLWKTYFLLHFLFPLHYVSNVWHVGQILKRHIFINILSAKTDHLRTFANLMWSEMEMSETPALHGLSQVAKQFNAFLKTIFIDFTWCITLCLSIT